MMDLLNTNKQIPQVFKPLMSPAAFVSFHPNVCVKCYTFGTQTHDVPPLPSSTECYKFNSDLACDMI